jgi:hypothetical protein
VTLDGLKKSQVDRTGTNIERAVEMALHSFSPHYLKHLVLITDGHETSGHLLDELQALEQKGVRVYSVPLEERTSRDVRVEALSAPQDVATEELFPVHVQVYSQITTDAEVRLRRGDKTLATRKVRVTPGLNRVAFETSINNEDGPTSIEADVTSANDDFANAITATSPLPFDNTVDTQYSTRQTGEPTPSCGYYGPGTRSVWYAFTPTASGSFSAGIQNATFTPVLAVYTGSSLTSLSQTGCQPYGSLLTFHANAGTTYYFQVGNLYTIPCSV